MESSVKDKVYEYVDKMSSSDTIKLLNLIEIVFEKKLRKIDRRKIKPEDITSYPIGVPDPLKREELYGDRG